MFSSPSGDGLVQDVKIIKTAITNIFVPEWGWVGSQWVHGARTTKKFSSPSGDRLVPIEDVHAYNEIEIFVPAWGWVGSLFIAFALIVHKFLNKSKRF